MKFVVKKPDALLDVVLEMYHGVSRQKAKQIIANSLVTKNGQPVANHVKMIFESGDVIELTSVNKGEKKIKIPKRAHPFAIYYEDAHLIVALKPAGILSTGDYNHPTEKSYHKELEFFVNQRDQEKGRLWVVHRLDREMEGLMLFARTEKVQQQIIKQWQQVKIRMLALVENMPQPASGIIENWLTEDGGRLLQSHQNEVPNAHFAKTSYKYLRPEGKHFLLEVIVEAGRNKQVRLHLAGLGCPIAGDRKYGADGSVKRQIRLTANSMEFSHPVTGQLVQLAYQPPKSFYHPSDGAPEKYKIM